METYIGIDVSKNSLEIAQSDQRGSTRVPNTTSGIADLVARLLSHPNAEQLHVIMEPTSTYHLRLESSLCQAEIAYTKVNPAHTRAFWKLQSRRAKTDSLDARLLADLGQSQQPARSRPPNHAKEQIKSLRRHLEWLEAEQRAVRNRQEAASFSPYVPTEVTDSLERTLEALEEEASRVSRRLQELIDQDARLREDVDLLMSIPGVGMGTAVVVVGELPAVEDCTSAKSWVAYCGVSPEPRESGNMKYSRLSRVGTARVRSVLYMAAVSAMRWNGPIRSLAERLMSRGKPGKVRVMAAMNKLLRQCFGVLRSRRAFDPALNQPSQP